MKVLHIVGRKKSGKSALIGDLVREFATRGVRVGVIKHCGHEHELDTPGKDSFLHRQAGATPVAVVTPGLLAVYQTRRADTDMLEPLRTAFAGCDLVLIEGYADGPGPKVEVWRAGLHTPPLSSERDDIVCLVSDDPVDTHLPVYARRDIAALADHALKLAREI